MDQPQPACRPSRLLWFVTGLAITLVLGSSLGAVFAWRGQTSRPAPGQNTLPQRSLANSLANSPTSWSSTLASPMASPTPTLAPCPSETATGCDKNHLAKNKGNNGSAACLGRGPATLTATPIELAEIAQITPMGMMIGGHVTPIDHGYVYIKGAVAHPPREAAVYAPLTGLITNVTRTVRQGDPAAKADAPSRATYDDYALSIEATCTFRVRFSNMSRFAGPLGEKIGQLGPNETKTPNYPVKAGELIGYTGLPTAYGIDIWVENDESTLTGFIHPQQYQSESWKLHMVDLFTYTAEPIKSQLLALDLREAEPRFGKIDHDQPGRLIGNWFVADSGGYGGTRGETYFKTHLAIVPDGIDPSQTIVSLGDYAGQPWQFAVVGNTPDPAAVTTESGVIKYELAHPQYYRADNGELLNGLVDYTPHLRVRAQAAIDGTILLQVLPGEKLKMEVFPHQTASQVTDFTKQAVIYER